jgi:hypothetical protein
LTDESDNLLFGGGSSRLLFGGGGLGLICAGDSVGVSFVAESFGMVSALYSSFGSGGVALFLMVASTLLWWQRDTVPVGLLLVFFFVFVFVAKVTQKRRARGHKVSRKRRGSGTKGGGGRVVSLPRKAQSSGDFSSAEKSSRSKAPPCKVSKKISYIYLQQESSSLSSRSEP